MACLNVIIEDAKRMTMLEAMRRTEEIGAQAQKDSEEFDRRSRGCDHGGGLAEDCKCVPPTEFSGRARKAIATFSVTERGWVLLVETPWAPFIEFVPWVDDFCNVITFPTQEAAILRAFDDKMVMY
jgi:hypothetical protein